MTSTERRSILLGEISVLDWYDGHVRTIARQEDKYYLITLVACDLGSGKKAYLLTDLDKAVAEDFRQYTGPEPSEEGEWEAFEQNMIGTSVVTKAQPISVLRTLTRDNVSR